MTSDNIFSRNATFSEKRTEPKYDDHFQEQNYNYHQEPSLRGVKSQRRHEQCMTEIERRESERRDQRACMIEFEQ